MCDVACVLLDVLRDSGVPGASGRPASYSAPYTILVGAQPLPWADVDGTMPPALLDGKVPLKPPSYWGPRPRGGLIRGSR